MRSLLFIILKNPFLFFIYLVILRFNLTGETDTEFMESNFPSAKELTFLGMLGISLYMNFIPLILDPILHFLIIKILLVTPSKNKKTLFLRGILFHIPIILFWLFFVKIHLNIAIIVAIILSFPLSGWLYQKLKTNYNT